MGHFLIAGLIVLFASFMIGLLSRRPDWPRTVTAAVIGTIAAAKSWTWQDEWYAFDPAFYFVAYLAALMWSYAAGRTIARLMLARKRCGR